MPTTLHDMSEQGIDTEEHTTLTRVIASLERPSVEKNTFSAIISTKVEYRYCSYILNWFEFIFYFDFLVIPSSLITD